MPYKSSVAAVTQGLAALGMNYALKRGLKRRGATKTRVKTVRKGRRYTKARVGGSRSVTVTRRRRRVADHRATENTAVNLAVGARRPNALTLVKSCMESQYYRSQGLTQYDTNYGFYAIANRSTTSSLVGLPVHVWDITACENNVGGVITKPVAGYGLYNLANGDASTLALPNQNADGTTDTTGVWKIENLSNSVSSAMHMRKAFHEWTHLKLNLYGVRNRATRWKVELIMVKDTLADFLNANQANINKKKLYDYLSRPFMFNNLNSGDPLTAGDIRVLRTYTTIIDPGSTDQTTNVPKIHTVNWFIRHNKVRRYDWRRDNPPLPGDNAAFDEEEQAGHDIRVDPRFRLYVVLRALSPSRRTGITTGPGLVTDAPDPLTEPSYDCVIRNKFMKPE